MYCTSSESMSILCYGQNLCLCYIFVRMNNRLNFVHLKNEENLRPHEWVLIYKIDRLFTICYIDTVMSAGIDSL